MPQRRNTSSFGTPATICLSPPVLMSVTVFGSLPGTGEKGPSATGCGTSIRFAMYFFPT